MRDSANTVEIPVELTLEANAEPVSRVTNAMGDETYEFY